VRSSFQSKINAGVERFQLLANCSHTSNKKFREVAVCPSWERAIPQVMQQHGGRNRYPAFDPSDPAKTEPDEPAPRGTSLQVYPQPAPLPPAAEPRPK
jgi:hypothetical protein